MCPKHSHKEEKEEMLLKPQVHIRQFKKKKKGFQLIYIHFKLMEVNVLLPGRSLKGFDWGIHPHILEFIYLLIGLLVCSTK